MGRASPNRISVKAGMETGVATTLASVPFLLSLPGGVLHLKLCMADQDSQRSPGSL